MDTAAIESTSFTAQELPNIWKWVLGLCFFKFGLENLKGAFKSNTTYRFDLLESDTFEGNANFDACFYGGYVLGSLLPAVFLKRHGGKRVLAYTAFLMAFMTLLLLAVEAATGGRLAPSVVQKAHPEEYFGRYMTAVLMPVWFFVGACWGLVDTMRRTVSAKIINCYEPKLRKLNAMTHVFYEIAGTVANILNGLLLVKLMGSNFAYIPAPAAFILGGITWFFLDLNDKTSDETTSLASAMRANGVSQERNIVHTSFSIPIKWVQCLWVGFKTVCGCRLFIWLIPCYAWAIYGHRYLDDQLIKKVAARYLGTNEWSEVTMAGLNIGEMIGAAIVFCFRSAAPTPLPWIRSDAFSLLATWFLTAWKPPQGQISQAFILAAVLMPVTIGWAAGDVSVIAFMQAQFKRINDRVDTDIDVSAACIGFLNIMYVTTFCFLGNRLGHYFDLQIKKDQAPGAEKKDWVTGPATRNAIKNLSGVQFTVLGAIILLATFVPHGALHWNPKSLEPPSSSHADEETGHEMDEQSKPIDKNDLSIMATAADLKEPSLGFANSSEELQRTETRRM